MSEKISIEKREINEYHYTKFVAHYDPRIGAVVVQSHTQDVSVGDIIDIKL